jgi:LemA protein
MTFWIIVGVIALIAMWLIAIYNGLVGSRNQAHTAWSQIDVQLKRRHDLVPNLVAAVRGHAGYERGTLEAVVEARSRALAATGPRTAGEAERALAGQVGQILALAEAYPDLKAAGSFLELQHALVEIEDHLQDARRYYNAVVRDLNTRIELFPTNLVAGALGFTKEEFFGLEDRAEAAVPRVGG